MLIIWRSQSINTIIFAVACGDIILIFFCYLAFLSGWWLPLIPSILTLNLAALVGIIWNNRQRDRAKFFHTLNLLLKEPDPLVRTIALEYFKQSENKQNKLAIENIEH